MLAPESLGPGRISLIEDSSACALDKLLHQLQQDGQRSAMVFACSANDYRTGELTPLFESLSLQIIGGVFPSIVCGAKLYERGTVVVSYREELPISIFHDISLNHDDGVFDDASLATAQSNLLVFADALSGGMEDFIERLYQHVGSGPKVLGGGAGYLDFFPRPCLFSNRGFLRDAAIVAALPASLNTAAGHGWEIIEGPYVVTESNGHDIISINYRPAFELYRETVQKISGRELNQQNFFEVAMHHPFGIAGLNGELLVRDPISSTDNRVSCVGNVPQNAAVYILKGDATALIEAAESTTRAALEDQPLPGSSALLFDCISRQLYLGERVDEELQHIESRLPQDMEIAGAFTLGEIANRGGGPIQLMNKSLVLGSF